ncbi:MAG: hypothetical protein ABJF23_07515 [Bryobacteraceae bacterium]
MRIALKLSFIALLVLLPSSAQTPTDGAGWFQLGLTRHTERKFDDAITAFSRSIELQYRPPASMMRIARAYAGKNDVPQALEWLEKSAAAGFSLPQVVAADSALAPLHSEKRYTAALQQMEANSKPCTVASEYKQFDFWVGEWDVTTGGQPAGSSSVQRILDGCVIFENWSGAGGGVGKSFNFYNAITHKWKQVWVDTRGASLELAGEFKDGALRYEGKTQVGTGAPRYDRLTFTPLPGDKVRQLWEQSADEGKTWTISFDGLYTRKP